MNVAHILQRVTACGYAVRVTGGSPKLVATRAECVMPRPLLKALKDHKAAVVAYLSTCVVCGRDTSDDETRDRMADALFCSRAGGREVTDGNGTYHPEGPRCPFKSPPRS